MADEEGRGGGSLLRRFIKLNQAACAKIEDLLPQRFARSLLALHARIVARHINERSGQMLIDAGGGRYSPYVKFRDPDITSHIVAFDISEEELRANEGADITVVTDLCVGVPLQSGIADVVATRSVLEHLQTTEAFVSDVSRVLKPGGYFINVFPSKYSPFALINRMLPNKVASSVLYYFFPEWKDDCGFKAYYDKCYYDGMVQNLKNNGFEIAEEQIRYYQSIYYTFFVPAYLVMLLYDLALSALGWKNLAAQVLLVARKSP